MKENKRIRRTQQLRWGGALLFFVLLNFFLRTALLPINRAEYTDGILQLTQFVEPSGIWPPLYTALCWPFSLLVSPVWSGRIVSMVFSSLAVIPLYLMARRSFGMRAAVFTALVYTVAPVSLRWSTRVMTDATFSFFFWFACERLMLAQGSRSRDEVNLALAWACGFGALAALTRYQGLLLTLPVLAIAFMHWKVDRFFPLKGVMALLFYSPVGVWLVHMGTIHAGQFASRTTGIGPWMTFLVSAEPFVLYMPYFLTYPVALLVMLGLNQGRARPRFTMIPLTLYVFVVLLVAQSLFASFQERYFLPLFGILYIWAGLGMAIVDHRFRRKRHFLRPYVPLGTVIWCLFISAIVLIGGREAFGDIRDAGMYIRSNPDMRGSGRIYCNEIYPLPSKDITAPKLRYFSRHAIYYLSDEYYSRDLPLESGDILVMSSRHNGDAQLAVLSRYYTIEEIKRFESVVTPVFPDIMAIPGTDQSALAWMYRYVPQDFHTSIVRIKSVGGH